MFRSILFTIFAASATAFSTSPGPAFVRPATVSLGMSEGYSHGLSGTKTKKDMSNTSSTDSQDINKEVNDPASVIEKVKGAAEDLVDDVKDKVSGDN